MKFTLSRLLFASAAVCLSVPMTSMMHAQQASIQMADVVKVLEGSRLVVDTPTTTNYPHLVKSYTHVSAEGCVLKYTETADESGKMVEGKPESRHSTYVFTVNLAQFVGQVKDPAARGQRSDHIYYSVPMAFSTEQSIVQLVSVNGVQTTSATLMHATASFEVEGQEHAVKLQQALNAAIQSCSAK